MTVTLPDGRRLVEQAPGADATRPYVQDLTVSGVTHPAPAPPACSGAPQPRSPAGTWDLAWLPASVLQTGGALHYTLSGAPDATWGSSPAAHPPSFEADQLPAVGFSLPSGATTATVGQATTIQIGAALAGTQGTTVRWQASSSPSGLVVSPSSGTLNLAPAGGGSAGPVQCGQTKPVSEALTVTAPAAGTYALHVDLTTTGGQALPPVVVDVQASP